MYRRAFNYTNSTVFQFGGETLIMLIISIFVALILVPSDPFSIRNINSASTKNDFFIGAIYTLFVYLILYLVVLLYHFVKERRKILDHKDIVQLGEYRKEGVALRNDLKRITELSELEKTIVLYDEWEVEMLATLELISPGEAKWLEVLNGMPEADGVFINSNHQRFVRVMNEKLKRLDMVLRKYLELPLSDEMKLL